MIVPQEQTATADFFVPVVAAWTVVLLGLEAGRRLLPHVWPCPQAPDSGRPWLDLGVALLVGVAIIALGQLWHGGTLDWDWPGGWGLVNYVLAQLLIWSPLPLALWLRRQGGDSAWTGASRLPTRLLAGGLLGAVAVAVYLGARGELARWPTVLGSAFSWRSLAHAAPVYLEGVGLAFLFVRLRWALGGLVGAVVPGLLFAAAHVPGSLDAGDSAATIAVFFVFNTMFVTGFLLVLTRYRDVVAIGVAHWLTDLAIRAF